MKYCSVFNCFCNDSDSCKTCVYRAGLSERRLTRQMTIEQLNSCISHKGEHE